MPVIQQRFFLNNHEFIYETLHGKDFKALLTAKSLKKMSGVGGKIFKPEFRYHDEATLSFLRHFQMTKKLFPDDFIQERDFWQGSVHETLYLKEGKTLEPVGILRSYSDGLQLSQDVCVPVREISRLGRLPQSKSGVCLQHLGLGELLVANAEGLARQFKEQIIHLITSEKGQHLYGRLGYEKMFGQGSTLYKFLGLCLPLVIGAYSYLSPKKSSAETFSANTLS